jgi:uncharacterized protein YbjQ (UPF0145 family)
MLAAPGLVGERGRIRRDLDLSRTHVTGALRTSASTSKRSSIWLCESEIGGRLLCVDTVIDGGAERSIQADRMRVGGKHTPPPQVHRAWGGLVGIRIDVAPYPGDKRARQFVATGTAVRAAGSLRTSSPFLAGLSAQDFTKLMLAGWVPADIAVGTACTWGSWSSGTAPRRWDDGNRELERWTEAVALAREQARDQMQADVARSGADGIVLGAMDTHVTVHELGPWRSAGGYCVAEATCIGTAIAQFRSSSSSQQFPTTVRDLRPA